MSPKLTYKLPHYPKPKPARQFLLATALAATLPVRSRHEVLADENNLRLCKVKHEGRMPLHGKHMYGSMPLHGKA
jgi:hypothetical protein